MEVLSAGPLPQVAGQADGHLGGQGPVLVAVLRPQPVFPGQQHQPELPPLIAPDLPLEAPVQCTVTICTVGPCSDLTEILTPARMLPSVSMVRPRTPVCTEPSRASRAG